MSTLPQPLRKKSRLGIPIALASSTPPWCPPAVALWMIAGGKRPLFRLRFRSGVPQLAVVAGADRNYAIFEMAERRLRDGRERSAREPQPE